MASPKVANNAPALAAIVCLFTLLIGPITLTVYKYAAFLFIITIHTLVLCQYASFRLPLAPIPSISTV